MSTSATTYGVLFVCMGNICRSPAGEGVFRHFAEAEGLLDALHVDSAGTIGFHSGNPADARMRAAAARRGYRLDSIARQVHPEDPARFDLVLAMDEENYLALDGLGFSEHARLAKFGEFIPGVAGRHEAPDVPDPYYGGDAGFERVLDMIESACPALIAHCRDALPRG